MDNKSIIVTPDGNRMTPQAWYKQAKFSHLPALRFYSERGQETVKTDSLVLQARMMNAINYVLEKAYRKGWSYQRIARNKAIERNLKRDLVKSK